MPCAARPRISSLTTSAALASSPVSGSSRNTTSGRWISAETISTFCFIPLENSDEPLIDRVRQAEAVEQLLDARARGRGRQVVQRRDQIEISRADSDS